MGAWGWVFVVVLYSIPLLLNENAPTLLASVSGTGWACLPELQIRWLERGARETLGGER